MNYEMGLQALKNFAQGTEEWYIEEFLSYERRLRHILREIRIYGTSSDSEQNLSRVLGGLNRLAMEQMGISFNDLCVKQLKEPPKGTSWLREHQDRLYSLLVMHFNVEELKEVCFHLGIEYEDILGEARRDKMRELILYVQRANRVDDLIQECQRQRPNVSGWRSLTDRAAP